jgi:hypothetical protein
MGESEVEGGGPVPVRKSLRREPPAPAQAEAAAPESPSRAFMVDAVEWTARLDGYARGGTGGLGRAPLAAVGFYREGRLRRTCIAPRFELDAVHPAHLVGLWRTAAPVPDSRDEGGRGGPPDTRRRRGRGA